MPKRDYLSREEYNKWMRERHARLHKERKSWALELLGGRCTACDSPKDLEFDHIDPATKKYNVTSHLARYSKARLQLELAKCQLLCKACHREKTGLAEHGTRSGYTKGCRCDDCTEANKLYYREYWKNRRAAEA